jgi:hypothetical protein
LQFGFPTGITFATRANALRETEGKAENLLQGETMATDRKSDTSRSDAGRSDLNRDRDTNPDPITGAPGSHPVGTGIGAAGGGLAGAAAGAAIGSAVPGIGTAVGGVVGAVVGATGGGLAGKGIAEQIDPTVEDAYWRENYKTRPYYSSDSTYDDYAPAYRYGWESRARYPDRTFDSVESDLGSGWDRMKAKSRLAWNRARNATRDAWDRVDSNIRR